MMEQKTETGMCENISPMKIQSSSSGETADLGLVVVVGAGVVLFLLSGGINVRHVTESAVGVG